MAFWRSCYLGLGRINAYSQGTLGNSYTFLNFSYNLADGLKSVQTPAGRTLSWGYDGAGRIKAVTGLQQGAAATYAEAMTYSPLSGSTITKEFVESTTYNPAGWVTNREVEGIRTQGGSSAALLWQAGNGYFANGNLQAQTIWASYSSAWTHSFLYDGLGRAKRITESGLQQNYAYDRYGNRRVRGGRGGLRLFWFSVKMRRESFRREKIPPFGRG